MSNPLPNGGLQIRSTVTRDGVLELELADVPVTSPGEGEVLVRIEAAPINPSDMIAMLAGADPAQARFGGTPERPRVSIPLSAEAARAAAGRIGLAMPVGLGGAGTVIAAGKGAENLSGRRVSLLTLRMGLFGQYQTVSATECAVLPEEVEAHEGADLFCNPLTALAMVETLRQTGQKALIHTAAASNLGQMLVRICAEDDVPLVNVVRRQEHVELLRAIGAEHVCNSSDPDFHRQLGEAVAETGATIAFDAIGGGAMAAQLLEAMETAAAARMPQYSPYGSSEHKTVYLYGHLDPGPTLLTRHSFGMIWGVEGWAMPPILARAGPQRAQALTQRALAGLKTTFASHYGHEISLAQALQRDAMLGYTRQATGQKCLVRPWL